jgi:hypothetical protein
MLLYVGEYFACMYVHNMCAWYSWSEEGVRSPGTGVTEDCVLGIEPGSSERAASALNY